jgi:hypothetical protein
LATPNFDLINGNPKVPIHVQANGGPWQILDQHHYRYPVTVPENNLLIMALSANNDKSAAISIIFSPEKALDVAKRVGSSTTKAPTFYVTANIVTEKVPGSDKTIKHIQLAPQTSNGTSIQTKSGLSLENNVTQAMIDAIVAIASPEAPEQAEPKESWPAFATPKATEQQAHTPSKMIATQPLQQQKEPSEGPTPRPQNSPTATIKPLQHTDTPQMILTKLKEMTENTQTNARRTWAQICDYLTQQRTKNFLKVMMAHISTSNLKITIRRWQIKQNQH